MQELSERNLAARDLACRRGDRLLFKGLSFDLHSGDALHVIGANGAGKTTLIRAIAGLLPPFSGEITHKGAIGLLDERPALDPDLPLGKALSFWEAIDGSHCCDSAIATLGIEPLLDIPVGYLSTGQRKRASLASLMNRNVPIWLLDEPLSGLDKRAIGIVTGIIAEHIGHGGIAIIASHQRVAIEGLTTLAIEDYAL